MVRRSDNTACYVELHGAKKKTSTREFAMVVCEVVQGYGPTGRQARVPVEKESAGDESGDDSGESAEYKIDARILLLSRGSGVLEWQAAPNRQHYGAVLKALPVESVVLVRAIEASASGPDKAKYTFSIKELTEAADR